MPMVEYQQCNIVYITNALNKMYYTDPTLNKRFNYQETGWHFIQNKQYDNFMSPKQWFDLVTNHSHFRLVSVEATAQNMIPLADNLSIAQDSTFLTFNNTIYALAYSDDRYETQFVESTTKCYYREGVEIDTSTGSPKTKVTLPLYNHPLIKVGSNIGSESQYYAAYAWDPFCSPDKLQELRPGKNAVSWRWEADSADNDKWYDTSFFYAYQNNADNSNESFAWTNDTNYANAWMTPSQMLKNDPRLEDFQTKQKMFYKHIWQKPIPNWFIKMIPIIDTKNNLVRHDAQLVLVKKIRFEVKPRINTTNFPQLSYKFADLSKLYMKPKEADPNMLKQEYGGAIRPPTMDGKPAPSDTMDTTTFPKPKTNAEDQPKTVARRLFKS